MEFMGWSVWLYDLLDFVDVLEGRMARFAPRPYNLSPGGEWDALGSPLPPPLGSNSCAGARGHYHFFDPQTMLFYVVTGDSVYVYRVGH